MTHKIYNFLFLFHLFIFSFIISADYVYGLFADKYILSNLRNVLFVLLTLTMAIKIFTSKQQIKFNKNILFIVFFYVYIILNFAILSPAPGYGSFKLQGSALAIFLGMVLYLMNYTFSDTKYILQVVSFI